MPEINLRWPRFTYSACGSFPKNKERIQKLKKNRRFKIYLSKRTCFQVRRKSSDKILHDKAFDIAKNPKYDQFQRGFASMVYEFFDKKTSAKRANRFVGSGIKNENI